MSTVSTVDEQPGVERQVLVWISFVDSSFAWASWQTAVIVGVSLVLLAVAVWVETRAAEPIVPLRIVRQRTTALAILGGLAAGLGIFSSAVFLSQYFQVSRDHTATEAGLLTIPMVAGTLISSIVGGRLMSRTGKIKPFLLIGAVLLALGFAGLSTMDQDTPYPLLGVAMLFAGLGSGMTMQNFVLAVQNTVPLKDIGAASSTVSFFRSLGGTVGVTVLGAVLARQVAGAGDVHTAYADATGLVFLICAAVAVLAVVAALLLKPVALRTSLDLPDATAPVDSSQPQRTP